MTNPKPSLSKPQNNLYPYYEIYEIVSIVAATPGWWAVCKKASESDYRYHPIAVWALLESPPQAGQSGPDRWIDAPAISGAPQEMFTQLPDFLCFEYNTERSVD